MLRCCALLCMLLQSDEVLFFCLQRIVLSYDGTFVILLFFLLIVCCLNNFPISDKMRF